MEPDNQFVGYILYQHRHGYLFSHTEVEKNSYLVNFTENLSEAYVFSNLYLILKFLNKTEDCLDVKSFILLRLFKTVDGHFVLPALLEEVRKVPHTDEIAICCFENNPTFEELLVFL